jgi:SAM-dependent methyltransferase
MLNPRTPFDSIPEAFERWRPRYCTELFDCVVKRAALGPGRRSLEIGPGTGQATGFALQTGADCTAIELGENLAAFCERKFSSHPNFHLVRGDFATYPFEPSTFDLVYSATTIQWIGEDVAYPRCRDLLRPGGTLAMFLLRSDYQSPNPALFADIQEVYDACFHTDTPYTRRFGYENAGAWGFHDMERLEFPFHRTFSAEDYVSYIGTHSDHIGLKSEWRAPFFSGVRSAIERHGGVLEMAGAYVLYLWTRDAK